MKIMVDELSLSVIPADLACRGIERHVEEKQVLRYKHLRGQERLGDARSNPMV